MTRLSKSLYLFLVLNFIFLFTAWLNRFIFLLFNTEYFYKPGVLDFWYGMRFDLVPLSYGLLPLTLALLIPFNHNADKFIRFARIYSSIILILFTLMNSIDVIYYRFTLKRTTWDIFHYLGAGDDFASLIPSFLRDYWYMLIVFLCLCALIIILNKKLIKKLESTSVRWKSKLFQTLIILGFTFISFRGGIQLKPLNIIDASRYTNAENAALLLSTPFTMMKTLGRNQLELVEYMKENECTSIYNPEQVIKSPDSISSDKNVVVIIMESLSREYIGYYNNGAGFTPFLDSLMRHSTVFTKAYANGKRSIEALPAIFSGLPNLMTEAHGTSVYAGNALSSLAKDLKKHGYYSAFYHGGKNGTMGFNSYINLASFDAYKGKNEYPDEEDFDGSWGIFDEAYFQYFAKEQGNMKEPFLSSIFSLSAHHPYSLPKEYNALCEEGPLKIHRTICYSDIALKNYFERIKKEEWYKRSIFIITADHTAQSEGGIYGSTMGSYAIPIIFFDPTTSLGKTMDVVCQQTDIAPTILQYLGKSYESVYFGQNILDTTAKGFVINFHNNYYQFMNDRHCIHFDGSKVIAIYEHTTDPLLKKNKIADQNEEMKESIQFMKAVIQQYNRRMIENDLTIHGD